MSPEEKILDLYCGQGRHVLELARRGFSSVEVYDRSQYLIRKARNLAQKEGLQVRFREGDARKLPYSSDAFEVVTILGNSFGYFDSKFHDKKIIEEIYRVLELGGKVFIDTSDGDHLKTKFQPRSWEWLGRRYFVCRKKALSADGDRLICRKVINSIDRGIIADQFYTQRLYSKESLFELLTVSGFSNPTFHTTFSSVPASTQDASLMEQRILISASVEKAWPPFNQGTSSKKMVECCSFTRRSKEKNEIKHDCVLDETD